MVRLGKELSANLGFMATEDSTVPAETTVSTFGLDSVHLGRYSVHVAAAVSRAASVGAL